MECGGLAPLFVSRKLKKSGAKPPHSKRFAIYVKAIALP
jgi:hypothetical protein